MFIERVSLQEHPKPRRPLFGVGINDAPYVTAYKGKDGRLVTCPYYMKWAALLARCYSPEYFKKRPSYKGCTLEDDWKIFSKFRKWMENQDWKGKHLDKDLLNWESKHYGPDTCLFITPALNNLLCLRNSHRGEYPLGVSLSVIKGYSYYVASCSFYGKKHRLGYFKTVEEAAEKYKESKLAYITELAKSEKDPRIRQALLNLS